MKDGPSTKEDTGHLAVATAELYNIGRLAMLVDDLCAKLYGPAPEEATGGQVLVDGDLGRLEAAVDFHQSTVAKLCRQVERLQKDL